MNLLAPNLKILLHVLDLTGTFVFALSGGAVAVKKKLDLFGVMVLSFAAGNFGGITRDVLIGSIPPAALKDWHYLAVSLLAGLVIFFGYAMVERFHQSVLLFDAVGLALFAVAGTEKALDFGLHTITAALLGMLTGIGGGIIRDVLVAEVPTVLRADLYAVAALSGATVVVAGHSLRLSPTLATAAGAALCFGLRLMAIFYGWHLPMARPPQRPVNRAAKRPEQWPEKDPTD